MNRLLTSAPSCPKYSDDVHDQGGALGEQALEDALFVAASHPRGVGRKAVALLVSRSIERCIIAAKEGGVDMSLLDNPDALAAWGVLEAQGRRQTTSGDLPSDLEIIEVVGGEAERGTARVRLRTDLTDAELPSANLEHAWKSAAAMLPPDATGRGLRVRLEASMRGPTGMAAYESLGDATGVASVFIADHSLRGPRGWHWPLRIGFGPSGCLGHAIGAYPHPHLVEVVPDIRESSCDLLFVAEDELNAISGIEASMVMVQTHAPQDYDFASLVASTVQTSAVALVAQQPNEVDFVRRFLDGLSHNHPVDLALGMAIQARGDYLVVGDPEFVDNTRISSTIVRVQTAVEQRWADGDLEEGEFLDAMGSLDGLTGIDDNHWLSERALASVAVEPLQGARRSAEGPDPRAAELADGRDEVPKRFLQAQVYKKNADGLERRLQSFEPKQANRVDVRVGRASLDWIQAPKAFPTWRLPRDHDTLALTVYLLAPGVFEGWKSKPMELRKAGISDVVSFEVDIPEGLERVDATITVYHGNIHLQSAVLTGPVEHGDRDPAEIGIQFKRGEASTADLEHKRNPDLSITQEAGSLLIKLVDGEARLPSLPGIERGVDTLRDALFDAAKGIQQLETPLTEDFGLRLLRILAEHGWELRKRMVGEGALEGVNTVLVTTPTSSDSLGVEFFYDFGLPDLEAQLCPQFLTTQRGTCEGCLAETDAKYVCPSGFWALRRQIERQVRSPDGEAVAAPESSSRCPALPSVKDVIFAASNEVNEDDPERVDRTIQAFNEIVHGNVPPGEVHHAVSWSSWEELVEKHYPALLVALPHTVETESRWQALQIASKQDLPLNRIKQSHIKPEGAPIGPIALLLGCNTANASTEYMDFVQKVRAEGASIVVGTMTYVLGSQAAPVAASFVKHLWAAGGTASFGEIMRQVRTTMLRSHNVMALALVAFGDADWRFTPRGR